MKKLLGSCLALVCLVGCSSSKPLEATYVYSFEENGMIYEEIVTLKGTKKGKMDYLDETSDDIKITIEDEENYEEFFEELRLDSEDYRACPGGNNGTDCSPYVSFEYSIEDNKTYTSKETIDYKTARKDKADVTFDQPYSRSEYFSFEKTVEELTKQGFTLK